MSESCEGCDVTEKCVRDEEVSKLCPCQTCLLKMRCSQQCEEWSNFFNDYIVKIIEARCDEL